MTVHDGATESSSSVRQSALDLSPHLAGSSERLDCLHSPNEYQPNANHICPIEKPFQSPNNASTTKTRSKKFNDQKRSRVNEPQFNRKPDPEFSTKPTKIQAKKPTSGPKIEDEANRKSTDVTTGVSRGPVVNATPRGNTAEAKSQKSRAKAAKRQQAAEAKRLEEKRLAIAAKVQVKAKKDQQTIDVKAGAQDNTESAKKNSEAEKRETRRLRRQRYRHRRQARERELATQLSGQTVPSAGARIEGFVEKVEQQGDEREVVQLGGTQLPFTLADPPMLPAEPYPKPANYHHNDNRTNLSRLSQPSESAVPDMVSRDPTGRYQGKKYDPQYHRKRSALPPSPARVTAPISPRTRYAYDAEQKRYYSKTPEFEHQRERYHPYSRGHSPGVHGPRFGPIDYARPHARGELNAFRGRYDDGRGYDRPHDRHQITTPPLPEQQSQDEDGNGQALDSLAKLLQLQADVQASGQNQRLDPVKIAQMAQNFLASQTRMEGSSPPDLSLTPKQAEGNEHPSRENELREILLARQKEQHPDPQKSHEENFGTKQDALEEGEITPSPAPQVIGQPTEENETLPAKNRASQAEREASPASSRKIRAAEWAKRMSPVRHVDPKRESGYAPAAQLQPKPQQPRVSDNDIDFDRRRQVSKEKAGHDIGTRPGPARRRADPRFDVKVNAPADRARGDVRHPQEQSFLDRVHRRETSPPQFRRRMYEQRDEHDDRRSSKGRRDSQLECAPRSEGQAIHDAFARSSSRRPSERPFDKPYPYVMGRERRDEMVELGGVYDRRRSSGESRYDHPDRHDRGKRSSGEERYTRDDTFTTDQRRRSSGGKSGASGKGVPPHQVQPSGVDVTVLETLAMLKAQIAKLEALVPDGLKSAPPRSEPTRLENDERVTMLEVGGVEEGEGQGQAVVAAGLQRGFDTPDS
ncbi:hypothetical protein EHS25_007788 [Saitozyma podzolica]|uniref:Uncharacterized protein n=1 Tax=Saitozyma podzolica TaxID=1890683 RepID=A0A427YQR8_9TREE|nr:hypothetical protein EHS25_007788 [Saitozyma podzolica]